MALPAQGTISEAEYRRLALGDPQGSLELVDGRVREKSGMSVAHGDIATVLAFFLGDQLNRDEYRVRTNHARLRRSSRSYYVPDVAVIPAAAVRALLAAPGSLDAYADPLPLVVEIWSPSTGSYDIDEKLPEYMARGDLEIWRTHPYEPRLTAWRRQSDGSYTEIVHLGGRVPVASLPGVEIDLDALFGR